MKHSHSNRPVHGTKHKDHPKAHYELALRKCEEASARLKSASEELAACWTALGMEIATGGTRTELLRRRAWCNVLELRLKEKAAVLEKARHGLDEIWNQIMAGAVKSETTRRPHGRTTGPNLFAGSWSLLLQPKSLAEANALAAAK